MSEADSVGSHELKKNASERNVTMKIEDKSVNFRSGEDFNQVIRPGKTALEVPLKSKHLH